MRRPIRPSSGAAGLAPLALSLVLLTAVLAASMLFLARQESGNSLVHHTLQVMARLNNILSILQDAETGQRGYLLTGDPQFLAPYEDAVAAVDPQFDALASAIADNVRQQAALAELRQLADAKLVELTTTIRHQRAGETVQALRLVRGGSGKILMDRARAVVTRMAGEEERLLAERQSAIAWARRWLLVGAACAILLIAVIAILAIRETTRRASLQRFLPAEIAPQLAAGEASLRQGRRQMAAIVFVDIRGSTALAEGMDPRRLSVFISSFRRRVGSAAQEHGGVVDKFVGDGALILFGVPEPAADDAARAIACARQLLTTIQRWNGKRAPEPPVRIGIGVHYGEVFCGVVGDRDRLEFTVLGDAVNVAARLEQATKTYGVSLLVSATALRAAGGEAGWREVTAAPLPGRTEALGVFAVMGDGVVEAVPVRSRHDASRSVPAVDDAADRRP